MRIYRLILALALPMLMTHAAWQWLGGRLTRAGLRQRLGLGPAPDRSDLHTMLWLHGASNGELTSARWLVARLLAEHPDLGILITCNTDTARLMVRGWGLPQVDCQIAPFDTKGCVARFLARWKPTTLVTLESELWPERMAQASARMPVILIGARLSQRSADLWARMAPGLMRSMLQNLSGLSPQDAASEARLLALGLPQTRLLPRLMLKSRPQGVAPTPPFRCPTSRARCILAASTHEGEDAPILSAYAAARDAGLFDLLILAPRHPRRSAAISDLIVAQNLPFSTRSRRQEPLKSTAVYLADTLGGMPLWYAMAGVTVIGGTFQDHGGHTPFEPAALGSALIHGPHVGNFLETFAALDSAGAALALPDADALLPALLVLDAAEQQRLAAAAHSVLLPEGDEAALLAAISQALYR